MSQSVYGDKMNEYRSQLNEFVVEHTEIQQEFDSLIKERLYSNLDDVKITAENLLNMVRDHPMYSVLKDLVFDLYCKNPRVLGSDIASAPNLRFAYESGVRSKSTTKVVNTDLIKHQIPDRNEMHQRYDELIKKSESIKEDVKMDVAKKQKQMTMDELKQALVSYGVNKSFDGNYLTLDMKLANVKNMLDHYKDYQLPDLNKLYIITSKSNSEATNKFFNNNFPSNVNRLYFYPNDEVKYKADLSVFIDNMLPKLKHVKEYFIIQRC